MKDRYASLKQGMVGAWIPSVSGSGLLLPDVSGYGNHGTLTNMASDDWVSGQYGRALDFDGVDDSVVCGSSVLSGTGDFTISIWVELLVINDDQVFAGNYGAGAGNATGIQLGTTKAYTTPSLAANRFNFYLGTHLQGGTTLIANTWYHLAAVRSNGVVTLYLNGTIDGSGTRSNSIASTVPWTLGRGADYSGEELTGRLGDHRVFNRALSLPEIKLLAQRPGIGLTTQRRTAYYAPPTRRRNHLLIGNMF